MWMDVNQVHQSSLRPSVILERKGVPKTRKLESCWCTRNSEPAAKANNHPEHTGATPLQLTALDARKRT